MENDQIEMLLAMGFGSDDSKQALSNANGNVESAIEALLSGNVASSGSIGAAGIYGDGTLGDSRTYSFPKSGGSSSSSSFVVQSDSSQYSTNSGTGNGGTSACTCIALSAASDFLKMIECNNNVEQWMTPSYLTSLVTTGTQLYNDARKGGGDSSIEHMSAEEVMSLLPNQFHVKLQGGIQQGVLSKDRNSGMGLKQTLENCHSNVGDNSKWMCAVVTKTPETVLVCLPPPLHDSQSFVLIDSHPRPQFGIHGSYARIFTHLNDLIETLESIFPQVDLGPDVGEMMVIMYNSFDVYPLQKV